MCVPTLYIESACLNESFERNVRLTEAMLMTLLRTAFGSDQNFVRACFCECALNLDNRLQPLYSLRCFLDSLRRQGSPVKIRRGPATVIGMSPANQATVLIDGKAAGMNDREDRDSR